MYLVNFVCVCNGKNVRIDRSWTGQSHANVVLKDFRRETVEVTLST